MNIRGLARTGGRPLVLDVASDLSHAAGRTRPVTSMRHYERLQDLIDLTYQAALEPELWARVFDGVAAALGADRAVLLSRPGGRSVTIASLKLDPVAVGAYIDTYEAINPIQKRLDQRRREAPTVFTDQEFLPKRDLIHSEFFSDFMRPTGMNAFLLMQMKAPHTAALNVIRNPRSGDFDRPEIHLGGVLQRPLARAYNMGLRLGAERRLNDGLASFVERQESALFLVSAAGEIAYASPSARAMLAAADGLTAAGRGLRASTADAHRRLVRLIGQAASPDAGTRRGGAIALPRPSGKRPLTAMVTPARGEDVLTAPQGPLALVSVVDPEAAEATPTERLRELFGFTAAEARVAAEVIAGHEPAAIADRLGLSLNTVRVQIIRIRAKTDTNRQGEFIALMNRSLGGPAWPREP